MVFAVQWLERGLGQLLAPDPNYQSDADTIDTKSSFWNIVAPDPNFTTTTTSIPSLVDDDDGEAQQGQQANNHNSNGGAAAAAAATPGSSWSSTPTTTTTVVTATAATSTPPVVTTSSFTTPLLLCNSCQEKLCPTCRKKQQQLFGGDTTAKTTLRPSPEVAAAESKSTTVLSTPPPVAVGTPAAIAAPVVAAAPPPAGSSGPLFSSLLSPRARRSSSHLRYNHATSSTGDNDATNNADAAAGVRDRVLDATSGYAITMNNKPNENKHAHKLIRFCSSTTPLTEKMIIVMRKLLAKNPELLQARSSNMNTICPDGYTPFMAAVYANQMPAIQLIWEFVVVMNNAAATVKENDENVNNNNNNIVVVTPADLLLTTNLLGQTAYHIAAQYGHEDALVFIKSKHAEIFGLHSPPPLDLIQNTPLAAALTSPEPKARTNRMKELLYDQNDFAIRGHLLPPQDRMVVYYPTSKKTKQNLQTVIGVSEMPGQRCRMEDYTVVDTEYLANSSSSSSTTTPRLGAMALFCVADGHDDGGKVAQFVAEQLVTRLKKKDTTADASDGDYWESSCRRICLQVDDELKSKKKWSGGAVANLVAITEEQIIVTNVGDCRCILVQKATTETTEDDNAIITVQALSNDHNPSRSDEAERIQNAGLKVAEVSFEENGEMITMYKVELSDGSQMGPSRSFGDFEYKANKQLEATDQAVTASPEVTVYDRNPENDLFLVAACDGVWDVMTNEDVATFVQDRIDYYLLKTSNDGGDYDDLPQQPPMIAILPIVGDELLVEALDRGTKDNMSVAIVALSQLADRVAACAPPKSATPLALDFE